MNFYLVTFSQIKSKRVPHTPPCFLLVKDNWDDFGSKTYFHLYFFSPKQVDTVYYREISPIRIMDKDANSTVLPSEFTEIDKQRFCSLGVSVYYYQNLIKICNEEGVDAVSVLFALGDVAYFADIRERFEHLERFRTSLLREINGRTALLEGASIIRGEQTGADFQFHFSCQLQGASGPHEVPFQFDSEDSLPGRIIALVGQNGTGKTQVLANLANALSFVKGKDKFIDVADFGEFDTPYGPPFRKIIAVSYSVFDRFKRPQKQDILSYHYCGILNKQGETDFNQLKKQHIESLDRISKSGRQYFWEECMNAIHPKLLAYYEIPVFGGRLKLKDGVDPFSEGRNSSGQNILAYALTEIIAHLTERTLVLYDEPEMYLHPNAIARLIRELNTLLKEFDSYAILSTHSPVIVQQIPAKYVRVFERDGNQPFVRNLEIESYGENLTTITRSIFDTNEVPELFREQLVELSEKFTYEEIQAMFNQRLSFNASMLLKSLYGARQ